MRNYVYMKNVTLKRVTIDDLDYLIFYDEFQKEIEKSQGYQQNHTISYTDSRGLTYISSPISKVTGEDDIFITFSSLKKFIKK